MESHPDFHDAMALMGEQMKSLQREFGYVLSGRRNIEHLVSFPNHPEDVIAVRKGIGNLIEGSLVVYLFAMWDAHVPKDVNDWLTISELEELDALRHIRDSVAHKYSRRRADFARRRKAFEVRMPFAGIAWDQAEDTIDLYNSSAAMHCYHVMERLNKFLVVRLYQNQKPGNAGKR